MNPSFCVQTVKLYTSYLQGPNVSLWYDVFMTSLIIPNSQKLHVTTRANIGILGKSYEFLVIFTKQQCLKMCNHKMLVPMPINQCRTLVPKKYQVTSRQCYGIKNQAKACLYYLRIQQILTLFQKQIKKCVSVSTGMYILNTFLYFLFFMHSLYTFYVLFIFSHNYFSAYISMYLLFLYIYSLFCLFVSLLTFLLDVTLQFFMYIDLLSLHTLLHFSYFLHAYLDISIFLYSYIFIFSWYGIFMCLYIVLLTMASVS